MTSIKTMNIRIPKEIWAFLKKRSIIDELPMNVIITNCLERFKNKCEKKREELLTEERKVIS